MIELINAAFGIVTNVLIPLAFSLCLFYFFWGVVKYVKTGVRDDKPSEDGKRIMTWGVIGIFVAFSIWGIISLIRNELMIPDIQNINKPK